MKFLKNIVQKIYVVYAFALFVLMMIPVFLWALLCTAFGKVRGGNLVYYACRLWADLWFPLIFIRHKNIYLQKPVRDQSYIYVCNHISYIDSAILPKTFRQPVRPLGKVEMAKIPLFGPIYKQVVVTVDRSSTANRTKSVQTLKALLRTGISILVFPEGTFNETGQPLKSFYDGAFRIAIETCTPIKPVLWLDNYTRMHYQSVLSLNPGRCRTVFMEEVPVEGLAMADVPALRDRVYKLMEEKLLECGAAWVSGAEVAAI